MSGNYQHVTPGGDVVFSASKENAVIDLLNKVNGQSLTVLPGNIGSLARLKVYNSSAEQFPNGFVVSFDEKGQLVGNAIPARSYVVGKRWGVLTDALAAKEFGEAIVSGPVEVEISSGSGQFATPASDGKSFVLGGSGVPVLCSNSKKAVILLGSSGGNQMLVELTSVPPQGFGNGKAKQIVGYTEKGEYIYSETEIPVRIPRL